MSSSSFVLNKLLTLYLSEGMVVFTALLLVAAIFVCVKSRGGKGFHIGCVGLVIYCVLYLGAIAALVFLFSSDHGPADPAPAPPHQLIFYNKDELTAFLNAPNLSDPELEQFLKENSYSMNGVDSRESLEVVLQAVTGKPFPNVKNAMLESVTVHVETNSIYVRYEEETGKIYSFVYGLQGTMQAQKDFMSYEDAKIIDTFSVNADDPFTAVKVRHDFKNITDVFFIETPETIVSLRLFAQEDYSENSIAENLQVIYFEDMKSALG